LRGSTLLISGMRLLTELARTVRIISASSFIDSFFSPSTIEASMEKQSLLNDDIFLIRGFLTPAECDEYIASAEQIGFADAPITTSSGFVMRKDVRDNTRVIVDDLELARRWFERAQPLLVAEWFGWRCVGLNERIRGRGSGSASSEPPWPGSCLRKWASVARSRGNEPHHLEESSMSDWPSLLTEPPELGDDHEHFDAWFAVIANRLLNGCRLMAGGKAHRLTEVEAYYYGGPHKDPFAHRDPVQKATGRWYFHRTKGVYRGGSFKGVDLTFGGADAFGGFLIRGLEEEGGPLVDGPSLTVDHLLRQTGKATVAELDTAIAGLACWESANPLRLEWTPLEERPLLRCARVGLSLRRLRNSTEPPRFLIRSYRFLSEPRRISKGKPLMVLGLHAQGKTVDEIVQTTGCPRGTVKRYVEEFETGRTEEGFDRFFGVEFSTVDLCRLHGLWHTRWPSR
jgi:hypothetical protein